MFFECLTEAIEVGERLDKFIIGAKFLISSGATAQEWKDLVVGVLEFGPAGISKCRYRYDLMGKRWKLLEKDRMKKEEIRREIRPQSILVNKEERLEGEAVFFDVDDDIWKHLHEFEELAALSEAEKMKRCKGMQEMNYVRVKRHDLFQRQVNKIIRKRNEEKEKVNE